MSALLSVGPDGVLTQATRDAIGATFLPRAEYTPGPGEAGGEPLPSHFAGATPEHQWTAPLYNLSSPSISLIRGGIVNALHAGGDYEIVVMGDSKAEGYNTGGARWRWSWPGILRDMLGGVEGSIMAFPTSQDPRWTLTNLKQGTSSTPGVIRDSAANVEAVFAFDTVHTGGSFYVYIPGGGNVTVSVDGGPAQPFTVPAGAGFKAITPTVAADGGHTYSVKSSADLYLWGFRPTYATPRLKVTNLGRSGATAAYWRPGYKADGIGLWDAFLTATNPDAVMCALGTNQSGDPTGNAAQLTSLWADIAALGKPSVVVTPGGLDMTGADQFERQYAAQLEAADLHNFVLIDFASVIGVGSLAQARGLMADTVHENRKGFAYEAAGIYAMLAIN